MDNRWSQLSMSEKAQLLGIYASKGYTDLASIINHYNSFATGGQMNTDSHLFYDGGTDGSKEDKKKDNSPIDAISGAAPSLETYLNNTIKAPTYLELFQHRNDGDYMTQRYSTAELDVLRKRIYANVLPFGYSIKKFKKAMSNPNISYDRNKYNADKMDVTPSKRAVEFRDELLAQYLGIPADQQRRRLFGNHLTTNNETKPSVSKNTDEEYYKINAKRVPADLVRTYNNLVTGKFKDEDGNLIQPTKSGNYSTDKVVGLNFTNFGPYLGSLGSFTVGSGVDPQRGQYLSYYDAWNLNPMRGNSADGNFNFMSGLFNEGDLTNGLGHPFELYDRVYLDDYYGISSKPTEPNTYYGGYLPEVEIVAERPKKAKKK